MNRVSAARKINFSYFCRETFKCFDEVLIPKSLQHEKFNLPDQECLELEDKR